MSGLQNIAHPPANDQSNLDPIFSKVRRLDRSRIDLGEPICPGPQAPGHWQMPASVVSANRVRTGRGPGRTGSQLRDEFFRLEANETLGGLRQIFQLRFFFGSFGRGAEGREHSVTNNVEMVLVGLDFSFRFQKQVLYPLAFHRQQLPADEEIIQVSIDRNG